LRTHCDKPVYVERTGSELSLSSTAAVKLLKAVTEKGKPFKFMASGWSMSPFIRNGDILTISSNSISFPQKGDVVGIIDPRTEKLVVHRIVGMKNGRYRIKGDNAENKDVRFFDVDRICGHVVRIERNGKPVRLGLGPERRLISLLSQTPAMMKLVSKTLGLLRRLNNHMGLN